MRARFFAIQRHEARHPAIGDWQPIELIQEPRFGFGDEAADRDDLEMLGAELGREPAEQGRVGQKRVEMERRVRDSDAMCTIGNAIVQKRERLLVIEPLRARHQGLDQRHELIALVGEAFKVSAIIDCGFGLALAAFEQDAFELALPFGRRKPGQRQEILALETSARGLKNGAAFFVDEPGERIGPLSVRISQRWRTAGFNVNAPAGAEAAERIIEPGRGPHQFGWCGRVEIRATESERALERAVLVQDKAGGDECGPQEIVREFGAALFVGTQIDHRACLTPRSRQAWRDAAARFRETRDRGRRPTPLRPAKPARAESR